MRVDLPSGGWVELRDPETITERTRRQITAAFASLPAETIAAAREAQEKGVDPEIPPSDYVKIAEANDVVAVALLTAWSFGDEITADKLLDLTPKDYDAIGTAAGKIANQIQVDTSPSPDPSSPTTPSNV